MRCCEAVSFAWAERGILARTAMASLGSVEGGGGLASGVPSRFTVGTPADLAASSAVMKRQSCPRATEAAEPVTAMVVEHPAASTEAAAVTIQALISASHHA